MEETIMKILMLSWEYPPISHGGLAAHVKDISEEMVKKGHSVYIITQGNDNIPKNEEINGVNIIRTEPVKISANNFIDDILHLNYQLLEEAFKQFQNLEDIDVVHGHDWLVFWASKVLKHALTKPLVTTVHATESGRHQGIYNDTQRYINDVEWYSTFEAWKVIVCSDFMKNEVKGLFQVPEDKIAVIENGVNPDNYHADYSEDFRGQYVAPDEDMIFYVGRIVREKGIQVLIQAMPEILKDNPSTKLIIAGKGGFVDELKKQANYLGIADRIFFTGFISDEKRNKLYQVANVAVFPSLYEPFGIVALEAMATETPVVVSDVGGLGGIVEHNHNGMKVEPNNPYQLARTVKHVLNKTKKAQKMAENGFELVKKDYTWDNIADRTIKLYHHVLEEYEETNWNKDINETYIDNDRMVGSYKYR